MDKNNFFDLKTKAKKILKTQPSIAKKLTIRLIITLLIVSIIAITVNLLYVHKKAKKYWEIKTDSYIFFLSKSLSIPVWEFDSKLINYIGNLYSKNENIVYLNITGSENETLFNFKRETKWPTVKRTKNIIYNKKIIGKITLHVSTRFYENFVIHLAIISIITILVVLFALSILTGFLLRNNLKKPFNHLIKIANNYSAGNLNTQELIAPAKEFQPIVDVLGKMGNKIKSQINDLHKAKHKYRSIFENAIAGIFQKTDDNKLISANPEFAKILGYDSSQDLILSVTDFAIQCYVNPEDINIFKNNIDINKVIKQETLMYKKNKEKIWVSLFAKKTFDENGNFLYFEGSIIDITKRKQAEENLKKHQEKLEELVNERTIELSKANEKLSDLLEQNQERNLEMTKLNHMNDLLLACRNENEIHKVLITACEQFFSNYSGYLAIVDHTKSRLEILASWGEPDFTNNYFNIDDCWALRRGKNHLIEKNNFGPICNHLILNSPNEGYFCVPLIAQSEVLGVFHIKSKDNKNKDKNKTTPIFSSSKRMFITRIVEYYALSLVNLRLRESLRIESIQDPLTGLYNRRYMKKTLKREISRCNRYNYSLGIIMIDIDHFKNFNDNYGHEIGDLVLKALGNYLKENIREEDIACRYGGEEFMIILPETTLLDTANKANELLVGVRNNVKINYKSQTLKINVSIGASAYLEHGPNPKDIIKAADSALYQAKENGRDRVVIASK